MTKRIAVIGGGAKGAAIAAKARVIQEVGDYVDPPEITIYESNEFGSSWRGNSGWTDGEQPLCTLAERDLGFPYSGIALGSTAVPEAMLARYSWQAFGVRGTASVAYERWVVQGRKPPPHSHFADYLKNAIYTAKPDVELRAVAGIGYDAPSKKWLVTAGPLTRAFDGVVITGSGGDLRPLPGANGVPDAVTSGREFWIKAASIGEKLRAVKDPSVIIIGAGGTAAAIAYWFVRNGFGNLDIKIVGRGATLYARHSGPFEDRMFTDEEAWKQLQPHVRRAFIERTTAGVVWDYVLQNLTGENITYRSFEAQKFITDVDELILCVVNPPKPGEPLPPSGEWPVADRFKATVFIDARGFNAWSFVDTFGLNMAFPGFWKDRASVAESMDDSLAVTGKLASGEAFPSGLHIPAIASNQGPAAGNLMALGWMSDSVLRPYLVKKP